MSTNFIVEGVTFTDTRIATLREWLSPLDNTSPRNLMDYHIEVIDKVQGLFLSCWEELPGEYDEVIKESLKSLQYIKEKMELLAD